MEESSAAKSKENGGGGGEEKGLSLNWLYNKITASSDSDLSRSIVQSTDSAIRSARHFQHSSSTFFQSLQDFVPEIRSQCKTYEDALVKNVKEELSSARDHPVMACAIAVTAGFILLRGPRRFLFRNTFGRLQSEEAQFVKAEKNVKALTLSVDLMKKESAKLLERANFAETEMNSGRTALRVSGTQIRQLTKAVYKAEAEAVDLMDFLREIPGRQPLKLRAEATSMASTLRQQRTAVDKRILKISELGVSV
ncbi:RGS1-HXK1-interacting protein 1 isoform X2 [Apium graveolens]|uniref:RGS1-HXK1-interacting protein 1 isoform X2 n=1 Tax=Apium graveolens TaxID=4045 RepID=UPI003D79C02A